MAPGLIGSIFRPLLTPTLSLRAEEAKSAAQSSDKEQTVLQGTWEGVEKGEEGKGKSTMTVTGNSMHFQGADKEEWYKATFKVLPSKDPQQLQATITESPAKEFVGKTSTAIFKIEDGTLTLSGKKPGTSGTPGASSSGSSGRPDRPRSSASRSTG